MAIEKLSEFAKDGQKNTDDLTLTDGFPVSKKPARQWFNWLFNTLTLKINEIIEADYIRRNEIVDNLTTNDATKPVSAKQAKVLQDNKLDKIDLKDASTETKGVVQLNSTLTSTSNSQALTAVMGKALLDKLANLKSANGHQEINGVIFQWFTVTINPSGSLYYNTHSFFKAFPNDCFIVFGVPETRPNGGLLNTTGPISIVNCLPINATTFQLRLDTNVNQGYSGTNQIKIYAVGV